MNVWFTQIYGEPGAHFPLSHLFQRRLSRDVTGLVEPSAKFLEKYGSDFELTFNVSAKEALKDNEVRGPTVFRKTKDVEYTVFLPFKVIMRHVDAPRHALKFLLKGVCDVFDLLEIDKAKVVEKQDSIIEGICADPTMLAEPTWNDEENKTPVRIAFKKFFEKNQKA